MNAITTLATDLREARLERRINEKDFFLPLAIIGGLIILVFTVGTHFAVRAFDRSSAIREQILAQNGISQRVGEVGKLVVPQVVWDDATANLDVKFDRAWAAANIGKYLAQTDGFDGTYVIDADNHPLFAASEGLEVETQAYRPVDRLALPLIKSVRTAEAARGPVRSMGSGGMVAKPIQASALKIVDGKLSILTATLVQPDFGKALPPGPRSPIVVTTMRIDQDFLDLFARRYMMDGLRIRTLEQQPKPDEIEIPATDDAGRTIAYFAWRPLNPGYTMLREFLPPVGLICLLLGLAIYIQLRKVHLAARALLDRGDRNWGA